MQHTRTTGIASLANAQNMANVLLFHSIFIAFPELSIALLCARVLCRVFVDRIFSHVYFQVPTPQVAWCVLLSSGRSILHLRRQCHSEVGRAEEYVQSAHYDKHA